MSMPREWLAYATAKPYHDPLAWHSIGMFWFGFFRLRWLSAAWLSAAVACGTGGTGGTVA
jgi:hypothetical protein